MELKEAIEWLKEYAEWVNKLNTQHPDTMGVAIDTVLKELDRLQKESISKNKILDKMVEVKLEFFNNSKDNDSFNFAYSNEYAHIEEVLRELLEEENNE